MSDIAGLIAECRMRYRTTPSLPVLRLCDAAEAQAADLAAARDEVARRDAMLDWLHANKPAALALCPYKVRR